MKMAKRVLAVIVAMIMVVGTCAVAASAAVDYQAELDAGHDITLTADTRATFTVTKDVTIDLGGHLLKSAYGKPAIIVKGGNVTVKNGQISSMFAQVSSAEMLQTMFTKSPAGISVTGGNLTVEGVRIIGSMARVPTTTDWFFPTGTAIMTKNGANVTLKQATLIGDYGVNDNVTGSQPGGTVTIEDAMIFAYNKIVKGGLGKIVLGENTEKVNAADRIEGFLNDSIHLEARERNLMKKVFGDRVYLFTKTPTEDQKGKITVTEGVDKAEVEADTISYLWPNSTSTDCSYELIPEAVVYSDGTLADLDNVDAAKVDEDAQIKYRVKFHICDDAAEYLAKFVADPQYYVDLNWWGNFIQDEYEWNITNNAGPIDSYNEAVIAVGDALKMLDDLGNESIAGVYVDDIDIYNQLRVAILELGGAIAYNKATGRSANFSDAQYSYYYGTIGQNKTEADYNAQNGIFGTLDRVQKLVDGIGQFAPFTDTSKWGDIAVWVYDNYEEAIDIVRDAAAKIANLNDMLNDDTIKQILAMDNDLKSTAALVNQYADIAAAAADMMEKALAYHSVQSGLAMLEANKGEIKYYADKFVGIANNLSTYITPSDFVTEDGKVVTAYATKGDVIIERIAADNNLDLYNLGEGVVNYSLTQADGEGTKTVTGTADQPFQSLAFVEGFELTAVPGDESVFLYWVNVESNRILSTETTLTLSTNIDRAIEAVFTYEDEPIVTFTNPTGSIAGYGVLTGSGFEADANVKEPAIPGFKFISWPTAIIDKTAYYGGSASAFADTNAFYGQNGATLAVRPGLESLIITPIYDRSDDYTVRFIDPAQPDTIFETVGPFGNTGTVTAIGDNFSYWADGKGNVVSLTPDFNFTILEDGAVYRAVYGATNIPAQVLYVATTDMTSERVYFYANRSINGTLLSTGIVFHYTNSVPEIGMEGAVKGTAKYNTATGTYSAGLRIEKIRSEGNGTVYARPYAETAEDGIFYGPVFTYRLG